MYVKIIDDKTKDDIAVACGDNISVMILSEKKLVYVNFNGENKTVFEYVKHTCYNYKGTYIDLYVNKLDENDERLQSFLRGYRGYKV